MRRMDQQPIIKPCMSDSSTSFLLRVNADYPKTFREYGDPSSNNHMIFNMTYVRVRGVKVG